MYGNYKYFKMVVFFSMVSPKAELASVLRIELNIICDPFKESGNRDYNLDLLVSFHKPRHRLGSTQYISTGVYATVLHCRLIVFHFDCWPVSKPLVL